MRLYFRAKLQLYIMLGASCCVFQSMACAKMIVDMYGDESATGKQILKSYQPEIMRLEEKRIKLESTYQNHIPQKLMYPILKQRTALCERIKKSGGYIYTNYAAVYYPTDKQYYITLEVVTTKDRDRLKWLSPQPTVTQFKRKNDVISAMQAYVDKGVELMLSNQLSVNQMTCSGFHCLFGFEHPMLKPYRDQFDHAIDSQQKFILETLAHDADPERRVAAAYLIGELHNPKQIISILTAHVTDVDHGVRNAVIRVIAETMHRSGLKKINVKPFIALINSIQEADRNKALFVLLEAADLPSQKQLIKHHALLTLQRLARLKQPNNQAIAAMILDKLREDYETG